MSDQKRWATLTAKVRACVAYCCGGIGALSSLCDDNKLNIVGCLVGGFIVKILGL